MYLASGEDEEHVRQIYHKHRSLLRAFALELLEWWGIRLRDTTTAELDFDELDLELLTKALEDATVEQAALETGVTVSRVKARYNKIYAKLGVNSKRAAAERALVLGVVKRSS